MLVRERTEEVNLQQTVITAAGVLVLDGLPDNVTAGADGDNDVFCVWRTVVVEKLVVPPG